MEMETEIDRQKEADTVTERRKKEGQRRNT